MAVLKEKLLAAHRFGLKTIVMPKDNEKDLADVPEEVLEDLTIHAVDQIDEVFESGLGRKDRRSYSEPILQRFGQPTHLRAKFRQRLSKID